jgi:hypothetical protein
MMNQTRERVQHTLSPTQGKKTAHRGIATIKKLFRRRFAADSLLSVRRYSLHFLMTNVDALPPIAEWHPRTLEDGRLRLSPMRDRPLRESRPIEETASRDWRVGSCGIGLCCI